VSAWDELDQRVTDTEVKQWRTRLHACVKAKGGYFEHSMSQLTLIITLCLLQLAVYFNISLCKKTAVYTHCYNGDG